jgi:hypothetical protein
MVFLNVIPMVNYDTHVHHFNELSGKLFILMQLIFTYTQSIYIIIKKRIQQTSISYWCKCKDLRPIACK